MTFARATFNTIRKHDLDASQRLAGTQGNADRVLEMKIATTAVHDHTLLTRFSPAKKQTHITKLFPQKLTSPRECNSFTTFS